MGNRPYAQINCTLTRSKKLRGLSGPLAKWVYVCTHLSELGDYTGLFRYPLSVWADGAHVSIDDLRLAIQELCAAGLVEYDTEAELCRIVGWFHKKNAPENASRMISLISDLQSREADNSDMLLRTIAEFTVGCVKRAQKWKPDSPDWQKLREAFSQFLKSVHLDHGEQFIEFIRSELQSSGRAVSAEVNSLLPALTLQPRCPHPDTTVGPHVEDTRRDVEKTNKRKDVKDTGTSTLTNEGDLHQGRDLQRLKRVGSDASLQAIEAAKRIGAI